jgi:hypothetical protein
MLVDCLQKRARLICKWPRTTTLSKRCVFGLNLEGRSWGRRSCEKIVEESGVSYFSVGPKIND